MTYHPATMMQQTNCKSLATLTVQARLLELAEQVAQPQRDRQEVEEKPLGHMSKLAMQKQFH